MLQNGICDRGAIEIEDFKLAQPLQVLQSHACDLAAGEVQALEFRQPSEVSQAASSTGAP